MPKPGLTTSFPAVPSDRHNQFSPPPRFLLRPCYSLPACFGNPTPPRGPQLTGLGTHPQTPKRSKETTPTKLTKNPSTVKTVACTLSDFPSMFFVTNGLFLRGVFHFLLLLPGMLFLVLGLLRVFCQKVSPCSEPVRICFFFFSIRVFSPRKNPRQRESNPALIPPHFTPPQAPTVPGKSPPPRFLIQLFMKVAPLDFPPYTLDT